MFSGVLFPLFQHPFSAFFHYPYLYPHLFLLSLCLSLWASHTLVRSSRHHPALCSPASPMRWWALNNTLSQQTFKRAWLASYMMGWCALLLLLGALVFWRRERGRETEQREVWLFHRPKSAPFVECWEVWDILSHAIVLSCSLWLSLFLSCQLFFFLLLHRTPPFLSFPPSIVFELMGIWWKQGVTIHFFKNY